MELWLDGAFETFAHFAGFALLAYALLVDKLSNLDLLAAGVGLLVLKIGTRDRHRGRMLSTEEEREHDP